MIDKIFMRDLQVDTVVGVLDWERIVRRTVIIDIAMGVETDRAIAQDDIAHTLNYQALHDQIVAFVRATRCDLIETLADRIAQLVLAQFDVAWVELTLRKPAALAGSTDVGITMRRERPVPVS